MSSVKRSFFWAGIEQAGPRAVQALIGVTLARLLEPAAFGLVGMLPLFISLAQVFADSGFSASLIQRKTLTPDDETSVWALNIVAGVTLAGLLCLFSPLVARFYKQPVLMPMLCVQSLSILISSFSIVQSALLVWCNAVPEDGDDRHRQYDNCGHHRYCDGLRRIWRLELGGFDRLRKSRSVSIVLEAERLAA
jgi:Polysaccharide biosynthesis protein